MIALITLGLIGTPTPAAKPDNPEPPKQICRRFKETGSFVRGYKICKSAAEWRRYEEEVRQGARAMQENNLDPNL